MKIRSVLFLLLGLGVFSHFSAAGRNAGDSLPNIVFFLADDIGWADPGRYLSLIHISEPTRRIGI